MFTSGSNAPEDTKVALMIRVPWRGREELRALAAERGQSLNTLLTDALTAALGIDLS
jgi:predicted HicB family RNase H-like nuclease